MNYSVSLMRYADINGTIEMVSKQTITFFDRDDAYEFIKEYSSFYTRFSIVDEISGLQAA